MNLDRRDCFIICPLGEDGSDVRTASDKMLNHVLEPVLIKTKYNPIRADQMPKVGIITTQIINLLIDSPLVIADLTGANPNVFYELAVRHAVGKPFIQIAKKGEKIPFDISGVRTIQIDMSDLDSVARAKIEIEEQIVEFHKGHKPDSPISIASTTRLIREDRDLAQEIAERISSWGYGEPYSHDLYDSEKIEHIYRKLWGLNDFSRISLEDLCNKLDMIINLLTSSRER